MPKPKRRSLAERLRDYARQLAQHDASGVPLMPKAAMHVRDAINTYLGTLRSSGHRGTANADDIDAAVADYGRTLQRYANRRAS